MLTLHLVKASFKRDKDESLPVLQKLHFLSANGYYVLRIAYT